ncbi:hypothetical protein MM213_20505, partial [Belliella sp. R4-6]
MIVKFHLTVIAGILVLLVFSGQIFGQCTGCTVTISDDIAVPNFNDGDVVCIDFNRTIPINFQGRNNLTICIPSNRTVTGQFNDLFGTNATLNNYGILTQPENGGFNIGNNFTFNNFGNFEIRANATINGTVNSAPGSSFRILAGGSGISGNTSLNGTLNIQGNTFINGNLTIVNSGTNGLRINLSGDGLLRVQRNLVSNRGILAVDNSTIFVNGNFTSQTDGDVTNGTTLNNSATITVNGNTILNKPLTLNNNTSAILNGNLSIPNNGDSGANINNNSNLLVRGSTDVNGPIRFRDNSIGTFNGNVNLFNNAGSILDLENNSDVLIQSNLTTDQPNGGSVIVRNTSQLVICNQRPPTGENEGSFPPQSRWGSTIDPLPAYYGGCRLLPVEFLEFNASFTPQNRTSTISWATGKEWENSHFEIERAIDNVKSFEKIGEVEGVGYSDDVEKYSFIDEKLPLLGGIAYYRLKQVDFSGSFSYSDVVGVRIPPTIITKGVWRAFPNPTSGESFNLELINNREFNNEELSIRLVTSLANHKPIEGKDLKEISLKIADLLKKSPNGVYILEVNWGQKIEYI